MLIWSFEIVDNGSYFNCLLMPQKLAHIQNIYVDSLRTYYSKNEYLIFLNNLTLIFDNILYHSDDPARIHTLRKYVGQAEDKTSVETARAKQ